MTTIAAIIEEPNWIPHRIDIQSGQAEFLQLPAGAFSGAKFLADYTAETALQTAIIPLENLAEIKAETGPVHFIFHTAFCRSTLLARVMNIDGVALGMSEPGIVVSLLNAGDAGMRFIQPCLNLLAASHNRTDGGTGGPAKAVFVKPTNHANRLIPALMHAVPQAKAIMMSNSLPAFLGSVNRKGLLGRRWARNLYLEMQSYAPLDMGIDARENFLLSDMQVAGLAWLLQRLWFEANMASPAGKRMRSLDSDRFNDDRAGTIAALAQFTDLNISKEQIDFAATSEIFTKHAKLGGDYAAKQQADITNGASQIFDQEVAMVGEWIDQIAAQAGLGREWHRTI